MKRKSRSKRVEKKKTSGLKLSLVLHPGGSVTMIVPWCQDCPLKFQPSFSRGILATNFTQCSFSNQPREFYFSLFLSFPLQQPRQRNRVNFTLLHFIFLLLSPLLTKIQLQILIFYRNIIYLSFFFLSNELFTSIWLFPEILFP